LGFVQTTIYGAVQAEESKLEKIQYKVFFESYKKKLD
jgi:hypothetical protein